MRERCNSFSLKLNSNKKKIFIIKIIIIYKVKLIVKNYTDPS